MNGFLPRWSESLPTVGLSKNSAAPSMLAQEERRRTIRSESLFTSSAKSVVLELNVNRDSAMFDIM